VRVKETVDDGVGEGKASPTLLKSIPISQRGGASGETGEDSGLNHPTGKKRNEKKGTTIKGGGKKYNSDCSDYTSFQSHVPGSYSTDYLDIKKKKMTKEGCTSFLYFCPCGR